MRSSSALISSANVGWLHCFDATGLLKFVNEDLLYNRCLGEPLPPVESDDEDEAVRKCRDAFVGRIASLETGRRSVTDGTGGDSDVSGSAEVLATGGGSIGLRWRRANRADCAPAVRRCSEEANSLLPCEQLSKCKASVALSLNQSSLWARVDNLGSMTE